MGQKTNPIGLRLAVNKDWASKWYAEKKEFGLDRLQSLLKAGSSHAESTVRDIRQELIAFTNEQPQHDDLTLVCLGAVDE